MEEPKKRFQYIINTFVGSLANVAFRDRKVLVCGLKDQNSHLKICYLQMGKEIIILLFLYLNQRAWKKRKHRVTHINELCWEVLFYGDVYNAVVVDPQQPFAMSSMDKEIFKEEHDSWPTWLNHLFKVTNKQIFERCGLDAIQFLSFQCHIICFTAIITAFSVIIILPTNFQGNLVVEHEKKTFSRTTLINLDPHSHLMWIHMAFLLLQSFFCLLIMNRHFSTGIKVYDRSQKEKESLMITGINPHNLSKAVLKEYYCEFYPYYAIKDIQLAYDVRKLMELCRKLKIAKESKIYCELVYLRDGTEVIVKHRCWWWWYNFHCFCSCRKETGRLFYRNKELNLRQKIQDLTESLPGSKSLGIAFVTFENEEIAQIVKAHEMDKLTHSKTKPCSGISENWKTSNAPSPENIIWENLSQSHQRWYSTVVMTNVLVFLLVFFFSTPAIILSLLQTNTFQWLPQSMAFIPSGFSDSVVLYTLNVCLPVLVQYLDQYLRFSTKSSLYQSTMRKTYYFLTITVVILPCLGLTSVSAFVNWAVMKSNETYKWQCIFIPDNGAFFVNYVMMSGFTGAALQIIHIPQILLYVFCLFQARSVAEKGERRKATIEEFNFGVQYAWFLLMFSLVLFYCIPCPMIAPFGLIYVIMQHLVDRHNMYFIYKPSKISHKLHTSAVHYVFLALVLENAGLLFFNWIRVGFNAITVIYLLFILVLIGLVFPEHFPCVQFDSAWRTILSYKYIPGVLKMCGFHYQ